jgi:adenylate cyclase
MLFEKIIFLQKTYPMPPRSEEELLRRILKLSNENKDLEFELRNLASKYEDLLRVNEANEKKLKSIATQTQPVAEELIRTIKFKTITVMFADIHGFSKISDETDSESLIDELDHIFLQFDETVKKYNIEKIKSIGDTYMAAGGMPQKNITNPILVVLAALEIQHFINNFKSETNGQRFWEIRIGVHSGPVTADISGKKKVSYDIKGDTVNIAHRIESAGDMGRIVISAMTYELVKEFFACEPYGKLPVKYKGNLELFVVTGILPELSENNKGIVPNASFYTKLGLIQFTDLQEIILDKLEHELPEYLHYHNVKHTVDVVTEVELIGWAEGINDEEMLILKTAALFHDVGHTVGYENHEFFGTQIAREMLPAYHYSPEQIEAICETIMATKLPPMPKGLLQEIICDSDLDYLGRSDFIPVSNTLFEELKAQGKINDLNTWNKLQVKFISGHQYFTNTARSLREVNKQKQIERITELIVE